MKNIAVIIPCFNEEATIKKVILDFKNELPESKIYVYDNNSDDNTKKIAEQSGAIVKTESEQGKGNVVKSMLREINADIFVLIDGDETYPANEVHKLLKSIHEDNADLVVGDRHSNGSYKKENKRNLHNIGNNLVRTLINKLYKKNLKDIMSGYRVFTKEFATLFPILSDGFELETEMTMFALDKKFKIVEVPIQYRDRPENSFSKLNTYSDGIKVLKSIFVLFKDYKPLRFFFLLASILITFSLLAGAPVLIEFAKTGYIHRVPSAILASGLMIIAFLSMFVGFILDTNVRHHKEEYEYKRKTICDLENYKNIPKQIDTLLKTILMQEQENQKYKAIIERKSKQINKLKERVNND